MITATVTKKSVTYSNAVDFNIIFNLILKEETTEVLNKDVSIHFDKTDTVPKKVAEVTGKMQEEINRYKSELAVFNSTALNNAVTSIQNALTV